MHYVPNSIVKFPLLLRNSFASDQYDLRNEINKNLPTFGASIFVLLLTTINVINNNIIIIIILFTTRDRMFATCVLEIWVCRSVANWWPIYNTTTCCHVRYMIYMQYSTFILRSLSSLFRNTCVTNTMTPSPNRTTFL